MYHNNHSIVHCLCALLFLISPTGHTQELTPLEIIQKSNDVYSGEDTSSRLTFHFIEPDAPERKLSYLMLWKLYTDDKEINTKMLFFKEFPPDEKDVAFMIWLYKPELNKDDDQWLYLPELRTVRKLGKKMGGHDHSHKEDDEFSKSVMHRPHLTPRSPGLDGLKLIPPANDKDKDFYIVERTPKKHDKGYPYSKTINWISKDNFLLSHIDYYDMKGKLALQQDFEWTQIGKAWVWKTAKATDINTGNTTKLSITDIQVNIGIDDNIFSKRMMKLGPGALRF